MTLTTENSFRAFRPHAKPGAGKRADSVKDSAAERSNGRKANIWAVARGFGKGGLTGGYKNCEKIGIILAPVGAIGVLGLHFGLA